MAQMRSVVTLSNSIIGVSILAMPFCFKQCGIVLAILMLYLSGLLVKATSYFLLKSAIMARRRNYETLAFNVFGAAGKLAIEVSMIGFLGGTCIAFFVVMGDLAPPIIAGYLGIENSERLRIGVILGVGVVVVLPLSLLRNIDSLVALCTASILFYALVMLYIIFTSLESLVAGEWWTQATKWRPAGIFQCLPIFTMALSCQAQLFEVYDTLPDPSLGQMVEIVKGAVNLCSGIYICVGFFGYIAFYSVDFGGNILTAFPDSFGVEITKMGFALSVAVSFPMVIFPCRTSINSILFARKGGGSSTDIAKNYIPHERFVFITTCVVLATLFTAIQIPDIELVLGIVGSTIGTVICILFPVSMFIKLVNANTTERLVAQAIFIIGVIVLVLGTYVTLYEADSKHADNQIINIDPRFAAPHPVAIKHDIIDPQVALPPVSSINDEKSSTAKAPDADMKDKNGNIGLQPNVEARQEPIQPLPPNDEVVKKGLDRSMSTESAKASTSKEKEVKVVENKIKEKEKVLEIKEKQANKLIKDLKEQKKEHEQIIKEQKEVLEQLKEHVDAEKALESNKVAAQQFNIDNSYQIPNNQKEMLNNEPELRVSVPPAQIPAQNQQAQLPVHSNRVPNNVEQPFNQIEVQSKNLNNPSPILNNIPLNNVIQNQPDPQQASNINQQQLIQNPPALPGLNIQPQQLVQNQQNNIQELHGINTNQAVQQPILQNNANQDLGNNALAQGQLNENNRVLQPSNSKNQTNLAAQPQLTYNQLHGAQSPQIQQHNLQPQVGNVQQQQIQPVPNGIILPSQQQSKSTNYTLDSQGINQQMQNMRQNLVPNPDLPESPMQVPNQQIQQNNAQQNFGNNQGIRQDDRNPNNVRQNFYPSKSNTGREKNERPKSAQNRENIPPYNSKTYVANRGKIDAKREINKNDKSNDNIEGLKVPGRDLKEAKYSHNVDYDRGFQDANKVKRSIDIEYNPKHNDPSILPNTFPQENLKPFAIAGAGIGIVNTRHLLSEDNES